jgi:hypothetical protein
VPTKTTHHSIRIVIILDLAKKKDHAQIDKASPSPPYRGAINFIGRGAVTEAFSTSVSVSASDFEGDNLQLHQLWDGGLGLFLSGITTLSGITEIRLGCLTFSVRFAYDEVGVEGIVPPMEAMVVARRDLQTIFINFASSSLTMGMIWSMSSAHTLQRCVRGC